MREDLEPLLLAAGTDLVLNGRAHPRRAGPERRSTPADRFLLLGHVHAYERTHPVARGGLASPPESGITHITVGDGGNREHFARPWEPQQPAWSALREYVYGWGHLLGAV